MPEELLHAQGLQEVLRQVVIHHFEWYNHVNSIRRMLMDDAEKYNSICQKGRMMLNKAMQ